MQSYLPTILIVVISWVSFWMDVDSVPGRTTLGVTTLLAVSSQSSGTYAMKHKGTFLRQPVITVEDNRAMMHGIGLPFMQLVLPLYW